MKTIWKYEIKIGDELTIEMPRGAQILSVQMQNGRACMWALVNSESTKEERMFKIGTTGNLFDTDTYRINYIGTFQDGQFVGHLFELFI